MNNETHTPEPWKAQLANEDKLGVVQFWMVTAGPDGDAVTQMPWIRQGILSNDEANARRIVACVNACAGIPQSVLERIIEKGGSLENGVALVMKQRDELAEALRKCEHAISLYIDGIPVSEWRMVRDHARAALKERK